MEKAEISLNSRRLSNMLRGISMLLVVVGHVGAAGFGFKQMVALGGIGVAIFLILSGYGLHESYNRGGVKDFWKKKFTRILIPYIIWVALYNVVVLVSPLAEETSDNTIKIPRFWFVEYIPIWYFAFWLAYRFFPSHAIRFFAAIAVIMFLLYGKTQAEQSLSFIVGVLLSIHKNTISSLSRQRLLQISFTTILIGGVFIFIRSLPFLSPYPEDHIFLKAIPLVMRLSFAAAIMSFLISMRVILPTLALIGLASYELYLVHMHFFQQIQGSWSLFWMFAVQTILLTFVLYKIDSFCSQWIKDRLIRNNDLNPLQRT